MEDTRGHPIDEIRYGKNISQLLKREKKGLGIKRTPPLCFPCKRFSLKGIKKD